MCRRIARIRRECGAIVLVAAALVPRGAAATAVPGGNVGGQVWTPAGNPYVVTGDITVPLGTILTIQAGTDVRFDASDSKKSGVDVNQVELTVNGSLNVAGMPARPVTFELDPAETGNWYGIVIATSAIAASIVGASITGSVHAITSSMTGATLTVTRTNIQNTATSGSGVYITAGSATLDGLTIGAIGGTNPMYGFELSNPINSNGNYVTVLNSVVVGCTYNAYLWLGSVVVDISSSTFDGGSYGVYLNGPSPFATLRNSIVTNASNAGVTSMWWMNLAVSDSDVWNNGTDYAGPPPGTTNISADPRYVRLNDYHLQASSPCIDSGAASDVDPYNNSKPSPDHDHDGARRPQGAGFDMGAYEYNSGGSGGGAGGSGVAGASGVAGTSGTAGGAGGAARGGAAGTSGVAGASGTAGTGGVTGVSGGAGANGTGGDGGGAGRSAVAGASGAGGTAGVAGIGAPGTSGAAGTSATGGTIGVAGAAGSAGVAGNPGVAGTSGTGAAGSSGAGGTGKSSTGCGCETAGRPTSAWTLALALLALLALLARRRRPT